MLLGIIVFSLLFVTFVVFGTLFVCNKGFFLVSGYRTLTAEQKKEFAEKNNLKKAFMFYAYYCYAVALVTLVALIGVIFSITEIVLVCYLVFGAGTIATMIISNNHDAYRIVPVSTETTVKSTPVVAPVQDEAVKVEPKTEEKVVEEKKEEKVEEKAQKPATKKSTTTTKKSTTAKTGTKTTATKSATKKSTK